MQAELRQTRRKQAGGDGAEVTRGDDWGFQRGRGLLNAAERSESEAPS